jgi:processive 1,2-diacylglycerol beta-glucosyltransferase
MIMGGGCGLLTGIESIFNELLHQDLPMQILAVTGTNYTLARKLETISRSSKIPLRVLGFVDDIAQLMEISDLLLTKAGGVTVFEALAKKLPMLIYKPLPGHERNNVRYLLKHKAAIQARSKEQVIDTIVRCVNDPSILNGMRKSMDSIARPFAARDAANIIIQMAEDYRKSRNQAKIYTVS